MNMFGDPSEKSLVEILQDRHDTRFHGHQIDESEAKRFVNRGFPDVHQDELGNYYVTENDYIETREMDGQRVAIFVADYDDKNTGVSHPYPQLPHPIGLYVREGYRSQGIGSELIHEFMDTVEYDRCVIDCTEQVKPFHEQLDCEVIFLDQFKSL